LDAPDSIARKKTEHTEYSGLRSQDKVAGSGKRDEPRDQSAVRKRVMYEAKSPETSLLKAALDQQDGGKLTKIAKSAVTCAFEAG
jgi:hypothetical protein